MDASLLDRHRRLLCRSAALYAAIVRNPQGAKEAKQKVIDTCERYPHSAVYVAWDCYGCLREPAMHFYYFPRDPSERKKRIAKLPNYLALTLSADGSTEEVKVHIFVLQ